MSCPNACQVRGPIGDAQSTLEHYLVTYPPAHTKKELAAMKGDVAKEAEETNEAIAKLSSRRVWLWLDVARPSLGLHTYWGLDSRSKNKLSFDSYLAGVDQLTKVSDAPAACSSARVCQNPSESDRIRLNLTESDRILFCPSFYATPLPSMFHFPFSSSSIPTGRANSVPRMPTCSSRISSCRIGPTRSTRSPTSVAWPSRARPRGPR